jgi:ABC-type glycerol-3-phosphate transport system substrate-binding protein
MPTVSLTARCLLGLAALLVLAACVASDEDRVYPNAEAVEPLTPGSLVPSVTVTTVHGDPLDLAGLVRDRGALLVFYRGGW